MARSESLDPSDFGARVDYTGSRSPRVSVGYRILPAGRSVHPSANGRTGPSIPTFVRSRKDFTSDRILSYDVSGHSVFAGIVLPASEWGLRRVDSGGRIPLKPRIYLA